MAHELLAAPVTQLGEGPGYDPATDTAWWFDILACRLFTLSMKSRDLQEVVLPGMASMMAVTGDGRQLVAMDEGLWLRDQATGKLSRYAVLNAGMASGMRTNDGRLHPSGSLWISSMKHEPESGTAHIDLVRGHQVKRLFSGLTIPNSICFSPDGSVGFFADTREGIIYRVPLDPQTGGVKGERMIFHDGRSRPGGIDGSVTDKNGYLWNARWGTGELDCIAPSGRLFSSLKVPFAQPSCPAFVGKQAQGMLITSAAIGLPTTAYRENQRCITVGSKA
jgi:sugar lactone lactonase YvrE